MMPMSKSKSTQAPCTKTGAYDVAEQLRMPDGATELEAIADGREAFIATVSAMVEMGQEVPAPVFNGEACCEVEITRRRPKPC